MEKAWKSASSPASLTDSFAGVPGSPKTMRESEKRRKQRPFLVSSRTNSRPQLPRYAVSSTLPLEESGSHETEEEENNTNNNSNNQISLSSSNRISPKSALQIDFEERREALLDEIMSLPFGSVSVGAGQSSFQTEEGARYPIESPAVAATLVASVGRFADKRAGRKNLIFL